MKTKQKQNEMNESGFGVALLISLLMTLGLFSSCTSSSSEDSKDANPSTSFDSQRSPVKDPGDFQFVGRFSDPVDSTQFNMASLAYCAAKQGKAVFLIVTLDARMGRYRWQLVRMESNRILSQEERIYSEPGGFQFHYDFENENLLAYEKSTATRVTLFSKAPPNPQFFQPPMKGLPLLLGTHFSAYLDATHAGALFLFDHGKTAWVNPAPGARLSMTPEPMVYHAVHILDQGATDGADAIAKATTVYLTPDSLTGMELKVAVGRKLAATLSILPEQYYYTAPGFIRLFTHAREGGFSIGLVVPAANLSETRLHHYRYDAAKQSLSTVFENVKAPDTAVAGFFRERFYSPSLWVGSDTVAHAFRPLTLKEGFRSKTFYLDDGIYIAAMAEAFVEVYRYVQ